MSAQPPDPNQPFVAPPPPSPYGASPYPPNVLASKAAAVVSDAKTALIMSIIGLFCFGFIFGFLAFRKANEALETIQIYEVAQDKKSLAMTAKILAIIDIVAWIVGLILRFTVLSR
ncbi:MAG TPA: hypothetical protein VGP81_10300 [Pyrinomonadaceae bacterium]|jgi:hypothetical protein|nr:hypothetical protein [Pyrinomonadaceae bacterium]